VIIAALDFRREKKLDDGERLRTIVLDAGRWSRRTHLRRPEGPARPIVIATRVTRFASRRLVIGGGHVAERIRSGPVVLWTPPHVTVLGIPMASCANSPSNNAVAAAAIKVRKSSIGLQHRH
jgi:hypothetical protein